MEPEFIILFFILILAAAFYFKDDLREKFTSLEGVDVNNPVLTKEQVAEMDDTLDNTDQIDKYIHNMSNDQTGYDHLNKVYPLWSENDKDYKRAHNLYDYEINPIYVTRDDRLSSDALARSRRNRDAILGAVRSGKDISKRIVEEELQENERTQWYEDTLQDITVDDPKFFTPHWKLPSTKTSRRRTPKY